MVRIAIAVSDLMFRPRIEETARAIGIDPVAADSPAELDTAIAGGPDGAVVDIHERAFDANEAIRRLTAAGVPVLAFGRHTEPGALRTAREAGAARVVPRSQLAEELPALLAELIGNAAGP